MLSNLQRKLLVSSIHVQVAVPLAVASGARNCFCSQRANTGRSGVGCLWRRRPQGCRRRSGIPGSIIVLGDCLAFMPEARSSAGDPLTSAVQSTPPYSYVCRRRFWLRSRVRGMLHISSMRQEYLERNPVPFACRIGVLVACPRESVRERGNENSSTHQCYNQEI